MTGQQLSHEQASYLAATPGTPLAQLASLAADYPAVRPLVAANPSTYPELLSWLGTLGDPAVDAALQSRAAAPLPPPAAPAVPAINPFRGVPVGDYVREGVAALLLLLSFALPWTTQMVDPFGGLLSSFGYAGRSYELLAGGNIAIVLLTLLALFSIAVTYLARAGILPATWGVPVVWMLRLAMLAPYIILVLVNVVISLVSDSGLGLAFAFGVAGVALIAAPRSTELTAEAPRALAVTLSRYGTIALLGLVGLFGLIGLIKLIVTLASLGSLGATGGVMVVLLIVQLLVAVLLVAAPLAGMLWRGEPWRFLLVAVGSTALGYGLLSLFGVTGLQRILSVSTDGYLLFFAMLAGAVALSPATALLSTRSAGVARWLDTAKLGLLALVVLAGVVAFTSVLVLIAVGTPVMGAGIVMIVTSLILGVGAVLGRSMFVGQPGGGPLVVFGVAGLAVVLGLVNVIVLGVTDGLAVGIVDLLLAFAVPILLFSVLLIPADARRYLAESAAARAAAKPVVAPAYPQGYAAQAGQQAAPHHQYPAATQAQHQYPEAAAQQAAPAEAAPAEAAPAQYAALVAPAAAEAATAEPAAAVVDATPAEAAPAETVEAPAAEAPAVEPAAAEPVDAVAEAAPADAAPAHGYTAEQALDPATDAGVLFAIAQHAPELRAQIAANPSTYPDLLTWLGQLDDPAVQAALAARTA